MPLSEIPAGSQFGEGQETRFGLGYRPIYEADFLGESASACEWIEIISENFFAKRGYPRSLLSRLRERFPIAMHGVGLSIGSVDPIDPLYLEKLVDLVRWLEPTHISDHLCFSRHRGLSSHDLLPIALTEETLKLVSQRVIQVQECLGRQLLLENPSAYMTFEASAIPEAEFFEELCSRSGCGILLDLNNLIVNQHNLGLCATSYIESISPNNIGYFHIAGHRLAEGARIDTHDSAISDEVLQLAKQAAQRFPRANVIVERDDGFPAFGELLSEVNMVRRAWQRPSAPSKSSRLDASHNPGGPTRPWPILADAFWDKALEVFQDGPSDLECTFSTKVPLAVDKGLSIYRNAYTIRLIESLEYNFPVTKVMAGNDKFRVLCRQYLKKYPPSGHTILDFGQSLPIFLHSDQGEILLADTAAFEWTRLSLQENVQAEDCLTIEDLGKIPEDAWVKLELNLGLNYRLLTLGHPVGSVVRESGKLAENVVSPSPTTYLFYWRGDAVFFEVIADAETAFLTQLMAGSSLSEACVGMDHTDEDVANWSAACIFGWTERGMIKSCYW